VKCQGWIVSTLVDHTRTHELRLNMASSQENERRMICVFAGSAPGGNPEYLDAARNLGTEIVNAGFGLVYGGAQVGLMGAVANRVLELGAQVVGVIPDALVTKEVAHPNLTELRVVESMHERKAEMADLADAFIALPGGFGTLEELLETVTWAQLGIHLNPVGLLNVRGYYDGLINFLSHATDQGFLKEQHRSLLLTDSEPAMLMQKIVQYEAPPVKRWLDRKES
jgi:uncharacterized protein (TIGR00730 family)